MAKQPPCCARREGQVTREVAEVNRLARKASRNASVKNLSDLDDAKRRLQYARQAMIDHESEHAA